NSYRFMSATRSDRSSSTHVEGGDPSAPPSPGPVQSIVVPVDRNLICRFRIKPNFNLTSVPVSPLYLIASIVQFDFMYVDTHLGNLGVQVFNTHPLGNRHIPAAEFVVIGLGGRSHGNRSKSEGDNEAFHLSFLSIRTGHDC